MGGLFLKELSLGPVLLSSPGEASEARLGIVGLQLSVGKYNMSIVKFVTHHVGIIITCSKIR